MLKGIDPLLNADALHVLRAMGHGDDLVLVDANFPAHALARHTVFGRPVRFDCDAPRLAQAVLSVLPVDTFVTDAFARMEVVGEPETLTGVQRDVLALAGPEVNPVGIERFAFYERAKAAFAIFQCDERRLYGCFAIRKGVIEPEG